MMNKPTPIQPGGASIPLALGETAGSPAGGSGVEGRHCDAVPSIVILSEAKDLLFLCDFSARSAPLRFDFVFSALSVRSVVKCF